SPSPPTSLHPLSIHSPRPHPSLPSFPTRRSSDLFTLALSLAHEHRYKEAIPVLKNAMAMLPNVPELKKLMGISLIETGEVAAGIDRKSTRLNSSHVSISYAVFCLKKKKLRGDRAR